MKGIHLGSLCVVLPIPSEDEWSWAIVRVVEDRGIFEDKRVRFSGDHWWHVEAEDGVARPLNGPASTRALMPEATLMPIDPLNDAARDRAMRKPVTA